MDGMSEIGPTEKLIGTAIRPTFPFFIFKIVESSKVMEPTVISVEVHKDIYKYLVKNYGQDEILVYLDPYSGTMAAWTPAMLLSVSILNKLGAFPNLREWVEEARIHLKNTVSRLKPASEKERNE